MRSLTVTVMSVVLLAACQSSPPGMTATQDAAVADTITQLTMDYLASVATLDADSVMTFHIDSDEFAWSIDAELFPDWESLASSTREKYTAFSEAGVTLDAMQVVVLGPDAGVVSGLGRVSALAVDGQQVHMRIAITFVVARRNGEWRLIHGHSSHALSEPMG